MPRHALIVDDAKPIQKVLEVLLSRVGFAVTVAVDAPSGLAVMRATLHPLLVLLDDGLPPSDSLDMLAAGLADPWIGDRHTFILMYASAPGQPEPGPRAERMAQALPRPPRLMRKSSHVAEIAQLIFQAAQDFGGSP